MAIDKWRQYLCRGHFVIKTDHQSLCHLGDQNLTSDLQRKAMTKLVGLGEDIQRLGEDIRCPHMKDQYHPASHDLI